MSDIWIKKSNTNPKWAKAIAIHIKRYSGATTKWFAAKVIWIKNTSQGWLRVWPTSGVFAITDPYITTTASGSTPLYGNQTVGTNDVIRIGTTYYGRNGTWDPNGFSISSYSYSWPYYSSSDPTINYDELGSLASGVYASPSQSLNISSVTNATATDGNYISFRITANASNSLYSNTADSKDSYGKIKVIRRTPQNISYSLDGEPAIGQTLSFSSSWNITEAYKPNASRSTIKWYKVDDLTNIYSGGSRVEITRVSNSYSITLQSSDDVFGKYIIAEETVFNTGSDYDIGENQFINGQNQVTAVTASAVGVALSFSNVAVKDYYGQNGLDNRGRWPTGTLNQYTGQVNGYDANTTLRIRYRVYNFDTGLYWKPSTGIQTTASAAWDSWNSDGSGNGYISNVSVNNGVATFYDYFSLDETYFNGGGSGPTWWLEIELSALKSGGTRTFYNSSNLIPETYYISKRIDPTVSVSPSTVGTNSNVTISGTFAGFPATPSTNAYPRQYIVYYGDGTNSGYLPIGEYANGTINPTYSLTKSYSNTGTYTVTVRPVPFGSDATATVTVANLPTNTVAPTLTTNTGNFSAGSTITLNEGTWTGTNSYKYEILYGTSSPIADNSTSTKTLVNTNQYVITNADATASSYYFRGRVTGYSGFSQTGNSAIALTGTSARSTITPSTTVSVGTATSSGFTVSGTASPLIYTVITEIQIWNSSLTSQVATITTGLPSPDTSTGAWSYVWTGGSASTTYYARVKIRSTDSDQTTITTGFAGPITTSAGVSTPTSLTATNNSGAIRLTFSGGSGDQYDIFYSNSSTRPTDGQAFADYPNVTSPYDPPLTARNIERWFWVRKSTGSLRSNWYPSDSSVSIRLPLLAPPTPVITNSAQTSTSLSWHWTQPTPSSSQDEPTSWDYNISTSTATPTSWTNITTRPTSGSPLVTSSLSASTTYYLHVKAKNADASTTTYQSGTTSAATTLYTVTFNTNGASGSPSVSSVTQSTQGGSVTLATIGTMSSTGNIFGGWRTGTSSGTRYAFGASFTPTSNITLYAYFGATPTCAAPAWGASNFTRSNANSEIIWYTDFPTPSGAVQSISSMQFQISTTQSTAGILIGDSPIATRAYPGASTYPYSGGGTVWAFKCGRDRSSVGQVSDIAFNTAARYARARVRMVGIDGLTYFGTYSAWY